MSTLTWTHYSFFLQKAGLPSRNAGVKTDKNRPFNMVHLYDPLATKDGRESVVMIISASSE